MNRPLLPKIIAILKWGKLIAKLTAIGTTVSGAITAISGSVTTGIALSAAGTTTYAATKGISQPGYEKTPHVPPGRVDKTANYLRQQDMVKKGLKGQGSVHAFGKQGIMLQGGAPAKHPSARLSAMSSSASVLIARKK